MSDDVDKLLLKSMDVNYLRQLCGAFVDLANVKVRSRDAAGLGVPIICSPLYVFIHPTEKQRFADALGQECPGRFFSLSADLDRFLSSAQPRKIHCDHVIEALGESGVETVSVLIYGCKSEWPLLAWLDNVDVDFEVDLGHVLTMNDPGIHLFGKGSHVDIGGFVVSTWPMLTSLQRDRNKPWYGSAQLAVRDRAQAASGVYSVKVYPTLVHVIKGLATANYMSLPTNIMRILCLR